MSQTKNDNIFLRAPKPVDGRTALNTGALYATVADFLADGAVTPYRFPSMTVPFVIAGEQVEYWFVGGIEDSDFQLKGIDGSGFELLANKSTNLTSPNDTKYPTTLAVSTAIGTGSTIGADTTGNSATTTAMKVAGSSSTILATNLGSSAVRLNATDSKVVDITGNAETVTNGVYTNGSYANPPWITSLAYSKLTGAPNLSVYELLANKQNSLVADGSGIKFPTVDAVNKRINWLSIKEYGAIGDGLTDESTAIQSAINASATTYIPAGTYIINATISIPSNHTLIFEEGGRFKSKTGLDAWMITNSDHVGGNTNINIIGGEFDGNKAGQIPFLAALYFDNVDNCSFQNLYIHDAKGHPVVDDFNGALTFANSSFVSVNNSKSENNNGTALIIMSSDHINVKGGFYSNNGCTGVGWYDSPYCSAIGVTAENNTTASGISANGFYSTVVGNNLSGNKYNINVGHTTPTEHYASYSTITGNTSVNGDYGINLQTGQVGVILSGNNVYGNSTDYVADPSTLNLNYFHKGISIKNQNPNPNASINIGANFNSVPNNTHIIMQGGNALRFTGEDGNADQGSYIFGGNNFIGIGSRSGGVNLDGISVISGKVTSSALKIQGGASLAVTRPELEFTTIGTDLGYRNWAIINNDLAVGDFSIRKSNDKDGDPITDGVTFFNIDTLGRTRLKKLEIEDVDYVTQKYNATSLNTNARNWSVSTNSQEFGDFEIRQSSSPGSGTDYNQGIQRFYINRLGNGFLNGSLDVNGTGNYTGNVSSNPAPTTGDHLTNKTYVDGLISSIGSNFVNTTGNQAGILGDKSWSGNQSVTGSVTASTKVQGYEVVAGGFFRTFTGYSQLNEYTDVSIPGDNIEGSKFTLSTRRPSISSNALFTSELTANLASTGGWKIQLPNASGVLALALSNVTSSAGSLTISSPGYYTFTGTTSTWTMPSIASSVGYFIRVINQGSGAVTMTAGTNEFWDGGTSSSTFPVVTTLTVAFYNNGTNWTVIN